MLKSSFSCIVIILSILLIVPSAYGQTRVGKFGVGLDGSMQYLLGAGTTNASPGLGGGVSMSYSIVEGLGLRSKFGINQMSWKGGNTSSYTTDAMNLSLYLTGDMMPNSNFNLFVLGGGGMVFFDPKNDAGGRAFDNTGKAISSFDFQISGGIGADYFINEFWSITLMGEYVMTGSPYYAGSVVPNTGNDSFMRASLQVRYYFFDQSFITKLLDAQRARSKKKQ